LFSAILWGVSQIELVRSMYWLNVSKVYGCTAVVSHVSAKMLLFYVVCLNFNSFGYLGLLSAATYCVLVLLGLKSIV